MELVLASARDEYVGAFGDTELKCDESNTAADARDEDMLAFCDVGMNDRSPTPTIKKKIIVNARTDRSHIGLSWSHGPPSS